MENELTISVAAHSAIEIAPFSLVNPPFNVPTSLYDNVHSFQAKVFETVPFISQVCKYILESLKQEVDTHYINR